MAYKSVAYKKYKCNPILNFCLQWKTFILERFTGIHINVSFCFTLPLELKTLTSKCSQLGATIISLKNTSKWSLRAAAESESKVKVALRSTHFSNAIKFFFMKTCCSTKLPLSLKLSTKKLLKKSNSPKRNKCESIQKLLHFDDS